MSGEWTFHRFGDVWISDRFVGGYDKDRGDYYVEDKYVECRYYRGDVKYHHSLLTLLNDRQGYINFILNKVKEKIDEIENNEEYRSLYMELYDELTQYKELWE